MLDGLSMIQGAFQIEQVLRSSVTRTHPLSNLRVPAGLCLFLFSLISSSAGLHTPPGLLTDAVT